MDIAPQLFTAKVMHKRLFPKVNRFTYNIYYLAAPLPAAPIPSLIQSFPEHDLGYRDGRCPHLWARDILTEHDLSEITSTIMLLTMPRVMGYVFNPVSFYLCLDHEKQLRAVICEVHNTFDEQHSYLCMNENGGLIHPDQWILAEKLLHVSPFLERSGTYQFRFNIQADNIGIWIDYYDKEQNKQLVTSLVGKVSPMTRKSLAIAFWKHPLVTMKAISLIHFQALKLVTKGIRYIPKPVVIQKKITRSSKLTKM